MTNRKTTVARCERPTKKRPWSVARKKPDAKCSRCNFVGAQTFDKFSTMPTSHHPRTPFVCIACGAEARERKKARAIGLWVQRKAEMKKRRQMRAEARRRLKVSADRNRVGQRRRQTLNRRLAREMNGG